MLLIAASIELGVCWIAWCLAFVRPRNRARGAKKNVSAPVSRWGVILVMLGYACIWAFVRPAGFEKSAASLIASMVLGPPSVVLVWMAARHLDKQWRFEAALSEDHDGALSLAAQSDLYVDVRYAADDRTCEDLGAAVDCGRDLLRNWNRDSRTRGREVAGRTVRRGIR